MTLSVDGVLEALDLLDSLMEELASESFWAPTTVTVAEELRRYAVSISPVVTGAYQSAHRVYPGRLQSVLTIDPSVVNPVSGAAVTRYAGFVEDRHAVYRRTYEESGRLAVKGAEESLKRLG